MSETEMCLRLLMAAALGFAVGLERKFAKKPAGLRTHAVVCVAAALVTTSSLLIGEKLNVHGESLRVAAGVVTGIGFIGAGTILQTRHRVTGLTTAATVFMAAAIGIAVGCAQYYLALTAAGLTVFSTWILGFFDRMVTNGRPASQPHEKPRPPKIDNPSAPRKEPKS